MATHFVGLGPGKAGTTYIYGFLSHHPGVKMGLIKETYFFSSGCKKTLEWYRKIKKVDDEFESRSRVAYGDISNQYFKDLSCVLKAEKLIPETKYIFFERDPLDRLLSCFKFEKKMGSRKTMPEFLAEQERVHFDNEGLLLRISSLVPNEKIFVIPFHELRDRPQAVFDRLAHFLDIACLQYDPVDFKNDSVKPRSARLARLARGLAWILRSLGFYGLLQGAKNNKPIRRLLFGYRQIVISKEDIALAHDFLYKKS